MKTVLMRDCLLAAFLAVLSAVLPLLTADTLLPVEVRFLLVVQALVLCLRRVRPVWCLSAILALQIGLVVVGPPGEGYRGLALGIAVYTWGALFPERRTLVAAGIATFTEIASYVVRDAVAYGSVLMSEVTLQTVLAVLLYFGLALLGRGMTIRRRYTELVELRAAEAAENLRARTEAALAAERARMARELHDVAAHHLTSLIVQATVVERVLDRDPDAARRGAAAIRTEGKAALQNLRSVVGALRETGAELPDGGAPVPGLNDIDRLVAGHAQGGRPGLIVSGEPSDLSAAADLTFYRVAQEALSNARDHAPGAEVTVMIDHRPDRSVLEVRNGPPPPGRAPADRRGRGFGLVGMRERAGLIGAALAAGPTPDGGWTVTLTVPRTQGGLA